MLLINSIKKSFNCIVENPSITLFLVLFMIGANILASYVLAAKVQVIGQILILCLFALLFVFFSGWFKVIKESCDREKIKEKNFYSLFLEGIGANIVPVSIGIVIYTIFMFLSILCAQFVALHFFGDINFFIEGMTKVANEQGNIMDYFSTLDVNQKFAIYGWNLCIIAFVALFNFIFTFYFPAMFDSEKNVFLRPLISIWEGLKFLFKNFFGAIGLTLFIYVINTVLAILNARFAQNTIISIILLLIYIYFVSFVVMLIFNYYETKNNSSDGSDCIGQDEVGNTVGEEN